MSEPKYRRYPVAPLLNIVGQLSSRQVEGRFGIHHTTVNRWRKQPDTLIIEWDADKYAIKLGKHPCELWDDWFELDKPMRRVRGHRQLA